MPIYEYECGRCGDTFEMIQSFSDKPLKKCKKCGGGLHKLVSECSFHLKGTGWYVTDYGGSKKNQASSKKETTSSAKSSPSKSDAKSETKSSAPKSDSSTAKKT